MVRCLKFNQSFSLQLNKMKVYLAVIVLCLAGCSFYEVQADGASIGTLDKSSFLGKLYSIYLFAHTKGLASSVKAHDLEKGGKPLIFD